MHTIARRPRSFAVVAVAAILGACGSSASSAPATTPDAGATSTGVPPAATFAPPSAAPATSIAAVAPVDWRASAAAIDPGLAASLPTVEAIGPAWSVTEVEALVSEPASGTQPTGCDPPGPRPAGLAVRFTLPVASTPAEYREGTLDVLLQAGDPTVVDEYVAGQIASAACMTSTPRDGATVTAVTDGLPEGTFAAYRLEFEPDEQKLLGEPITVLADATFLWMRRGDEVAAVVVSLLQMDDHPALADSTDEAIRIAQSISLG